MPFFFLAAAAASAFFPLPFLPFFFLPDEPTTFFSDLSSALIEAFLLMALLYFFLAFFFAFFVAFLFFSAFGTFGTVPWQTMAVSPTGFGSSAVNRGRSCGTAPPTLTPSTCWAPGAGQYDARSM